MKIWLQLSPQFSVAGCWIICLLAHKEHSCQDLFVSVKLTKAYTAEKVTQSSEGNFLVAGSHQRAYQVKVHELQGLSHSDVHVCCGIWLPWVGGKFWFLPWIVDDHWFKEGADAVVRLLQTPVRYLKTLLLPINLLLLALIVWRVTSVFVCRRATIPIDEQIIAVFPFSIKAPVE